MKPSAKNAIEIFEAIQEQLGPEYLAFWVLPNVVLTLSGARAFCDGVFWDDKRKGLLGKWKKEIAESAEIVKQKTKLVWADIDIFEPRPKEKYAGFDILTEKGLHYIFEQTKLVDKQLFNEVSAQKTLNKTFLVLDRHLRSRPELKNLFKKDWVRKGWEDIAYGFLLGYPDKAILESMPVWGSKGKDPFAEGLVDADIRGAAYYACPQPIYSYPRHLMNDPDIKAHEKLWSDLLWSYYHSDFHKSLEKDKTFQRKMKELGNEW